MTARLAVMLLIGISVSAYAGGWETPDSAALKQLFSDTTVKGKRFAGYYASDGSQTRTWGGNKTTVNGRSINRDIYAMQPLGRLEVGRQGVGC